MSPYIPQGDREAATYRPLSPGELNYALTHVLTQYLEDHGLSYTTIAECMGALSCAQAEFYRRVAVPYEDQKIKAAGDMYPA